MTTAPTDSILAADIGSVTTRAALFDIVSGGFRFIAVGEARSSIEPPFSYMGEGLRHAAEQLTALTGRKFMDENERLIMPARADGAGTDAFAVSASGVKPLRTVLVGLMPNISLLSAERVALSGHLQIVERLGLGDGRKREKQIDDLLNARLDLAIIAGGTDFGSQGAVLQLADTVAIAARLMREGARPEVLFIGNAALHERVKDLFVGVCEVAVTENVRPSLGEENLASARRMLAHIYEHARLGSLPGYGELAQWSGSGVAPNSAALGMLIRHFSEVSKDAAVLGVDIGSATTTLAAAIGEDLAITVRADLGVGHSAGYQANALDKIARWLPDRFSDEEIRDYVSNKSLAPASVPYELRDLYLEHGLARQCLLNATQGANWPAKAKGVPGLTPNFDTIVGTGAVLARAPKPGQAALILLDSLQPSGVTTLVLDTQNLLPLLGAAAGLNPVAVVQTLEAGALTTLGTAVTASGEGRQGQAAVRVKGTLADGQQIKEDVAYGQLAVFKMPPGDSKVTVQPLGGLDIGFGRGNAKTLTLSESAVGLIIDARGRPINFPGSAEARREAVSRWCGALGQYGL
jgi:hypothetical protein